MGWRVDDSSRPRSGLRGFWVPARHRAPAATGDFALRYGRWAVIQRSVTGRWLHFSQALLNPVLLGAAALAIEPRPGTLLAFGGLCLAKVGIDGASGRTLRPGGFRARQLLLVPAKDLLFGWAWARGLLEGRLRVALVAGARPAVRDALMESIAGARLRGAPGLELLFDADLGGYFRRFNELMARTDILWTKPSELTFFAALGLPVICAPPVGVHERRNRRWVRESGAGMKQHEPAFAAEWLSDMLADGQLAGAAWAGYVRLPKNGLYRIVEELKRERAA